MSLPFPSPTIPAPSRSAVMIGYLDFFRATAIEKVDGLGEADLRASRLPSGWSPLELLVHLTHVERRWLVWGFLGEQVDDPWADQRDGHWYVDPSISVDEVTTALRRQGATSRQIIQSHDLDGIGRPGPRWDGAAPPTLERVCLHLVQEYARHVGHLDVVRELVDGSVGE